MKPRLGGRGTAFSDLTVWQRCPKTRLESQCCSWARNSSADKRWSDNPAAGGVPYWELLNLRRRHPWLAGEGLNVFHLNNANRILASQRWLEGFGMPSVNQSQRSDFLQLRNWLSRPGPLAIHMGDTMLPLGGATAIGASVL